MCPNLMCLNKLGDITEVMAGEGEDAGEGVDEAVESEIGIMRDDNTEAMDEGGSISNVGDMTLEEGMLNILTYSNS